MTKPPLVSTQVWQPPKPSARSRHAASDTPVRLDVFDTPGIGPEDVAVDAEGWIYAGLIDGRILRISPDASSIDTIATTGGRPLGVEIDGDGALVVCDARLGVLNVDPRTGAVRTLTDRVDGQEMVFCNNSALGRDGTVYFTDSSKYFGIDHWKAELLAHTGTGRLFRRSPDGTVDLLVDGLQFANGVALAPDESYVVVAETGAYTLVRLWLSGPRAGERELLVENLPGFPDNISTGSDGNVWVALASPRDRALDALLPRNPLLRKAAWALPDALQPKEKKTVWVQAYSGLGELVHDVQTAHKKFFMVTGVREVGGTVWLGSLHAPAIARFEL
jgi:sugar lactone lactonase YvrE